MIQSNIVFSSVSSIFKASVITNSQWIRRYLNFSIRVAPVNDSWHQDKTIVPLWLRNENGFNFRCDVRTIFFLYNYTGCSIMPVLTVTVTQGLPLGGVILNFELFFICKDQNCRYVS